MASLASYIPTRTLLWAGVIGPIAFIVTFVVEGATRAGYDPVRHFVSLLALGDGGWAQVANFVVGGALLVAFGVGLGRTWATGPGSRWGPRLVAAVGIGLISAGVFTGDPALGFPAGAPAGLPAAASWHAGIHYLASVVVFLGLPAATFVAARRALAAGNRTKAWYSIASGVVTLAGWLTPFVVVGAGGVSTIAGLSQRVAIGAGFQWLVVIALIELGLVARPLVSRQA